MTKAVAGTSNNFPQVDRYDLDQTNSILDSLMHSDDEQAEEIFTDGVKLTVDVEEDDLGESNSNSMIDEDDIEPVEALGSSDTDRGESQETQEGSQQRNNNRQISAAEPVEVTPGVATQVITNDEQVSQFLESNPYLGNYFKKLIQEGIAEGPQRVAQKTKGRSGETEPSVNAEKGGLTPKRRSTMIQQVKSPSDTTIYAPALKKLVGNTVNEGDHLIERISNFVEEIRLETASREQTPKRASGRDLQQQRDVWDCKAGTSDQSGDVMVDNDAPEGSQHEADSLIIEAEQYKAAVEPPVAGMNDVVQISQANESAKQIDKIPSQPDWGDDDDYFHLTCHVDGTLKTKIERGEYIELERLLPRRRAADSRLEWISKDGMTFLSPVQDKETKINGIKRWDQAFRIYAAIYCNANPTRSGEIWQYIYTIHSAAASYQWDNVSYYDNTFRQMMNDRPNRSWSKIYTQLSQLALKDPIQKVNWSNSSMSGGTNPGSSVPQGGGNQPKHKTWRDRCCWDFNRTGSWCKFDNRCSYCGAWNHGSHNCYKKGNGNSGKGSSSKGQNNTKK